MNFDRRLFSQIKNVKGRLGLAVLAGFLAAIAVILQARWLSQIVAGVFLKGQGLPEMTPLMGGLLAAAAARAGCTYLSETSASEAAQAVKARLRDELTAHLLALGPAYTQGERSGELVNTVTQGIDALDAYFSQYLPQLALAGLLPVVYLAVVIPLDPLSGLVLLLTGPLIPVFMALIGNIAQKLTGRQWTALSRMSAYFLDTLQGLTTLKALGRSKEQAERIGQVSERYRAATMNVLRVTFLSALTLELLGTLGTAIIAVEIGLRLLYGRMGFEGAFFILLLAPEFYLPLRTLGLRFHASMAGAAAARRIFQVLEQPLPQPAPDRSIHSAVELQKPFHLQLDNIFYTYPERERPALAGVSLGIRSGEMVALVGPSGSGKSTLAHLLLRFMIPDSGEITVNGRPLASIPVESWRAQIAWVPQRPHLFQGTLADNLRLARPGAALADLRRAAEQAHLLDWIDTLPAGFETPVGEGGARISGGQAQRVALARAFLRNAPFLLLDEPTAHLDVEHEARLQESLARLCAGKTVLVIAHRLPTITRADQIILLDAGRVVEQGRHTDLVANNGLYAHLVAVYGGNHG